MWMWRNVPTSRYSTGQPRTQVRFEDPKADNSPNKGEVWGKIDEDKLIVNRDVLLAFLDQNGFDYTAVSKKWSEKGYLVRNSQGKFIHRQRCMGSSPVISSLGCRRMMTQQIKMDLCRSRDMSRRPCPLIKGSNLL